MKDRDLSRLLEDMVARILAEQNATKKLLNSGIMKIMR